MSEDILWHPEISNPVKISFQTSPLAQVRTILQSHFVWVVFVKSVGFTSVPDAIGPCVNPVAPLRPITWTNALYFANVAQKLQFPGKNHLLGYYRAHDMFSRILNLRIPFFSLMFFYMDFHLRIKIAKKQPQKYQIDNSGFVKTCDEHQI